MTRSSDARRADVGAWSALAALAAMVGVPCALPFARLPIASFTAEWVAVAAGFAAMVTFAAGRPAALARIPRAVVLPAGIATLWAVHAATGHAADARLALLTSLVLWWAAGVVWVAAGVRDALGAERVERVVAWAVVGGAVANALAGLVQRAGIPPGLQPFVMPPLDARVYGNLGQANHLADQLCLALAALGALAGMTRAPLALLLAPTALFGVVLAMTGSRTGLLALVALAAIGSAGAWRAVGPGRLRLGAVVAVALLAWGATEAVLATHARAGPGATAAGAAVVADDASGATPSAAARLAGPPPWADERATIWRGAWSLFVAHPWIGVGEGGFARGFFDRVATLPPPHPPLMTAQAHNLVLQIAAEAGIAGLVLLFAGVAWVVADLRAGAPGPVRRWAVASVAVVALHSAVEYPLWYAYFLGPVALWLGLAGGPGWVTPGRSRLRPVAAVAIAAGGAFVLVTLWADWRFLRDFAGSRRTEYLARGDDWVRERLLGISRQSLLAHLARLGFVRAMRIDASHLDDKLTVSAAVMRTTPTPDVVWRHALLLAASGRDAEARTLWRAARAAYPSAETQWVATARSAAQAASAPLPQLDAFVSSVQGDLP